MYLSGPYRQAVEEFVTEHPQARAGVVAHVAGELGVALLLRYPTPTLPFAEGVALVQAYWGHLFLPETDPLEVSGGMVQQMLDAAAAGLIDQDVAESFRKRFETLDPLQRVVLLGRLRLALELLREPKGRPSRTHRPLSIREALTASGLVDPED